MSIIHTDFSTNVFMACYTKMRMIQKIRRIENGLTNSELNNLRQQIYVEKIEKLKKVPNYIQKVTFILIHLE